MKKLILTLLTLSGALLAQIPNAGFENWTTVGSYEVPNGWSTLNNKTAANGLFTATKGTPGTAGNSYLKLTAQSIAGGIVKGIAVSGKMDTITMEPISGFAYTGRPALFKGKWQYMVYGNAIGSIKILLSKWNATTHERDTIAYLNKTLPGMIMTWSNFALTLNYKDSLQFPDSCLIVLSASDGPSTANDYLWVDELAFSGSVPVVDPPVEDPVGLNKYISNSIKFDLAPNPAKNNVVVTFGSAGKEIVSVEIMDATGKVVKKISTISSSNTSVNIETEGLTHGLYMVVLRSETTSATRKLIIE